MEEPKGLKVIAERLNLSESTVSRALNDYRDISARTKARVRDVAEELGYEPNTHARRLASGKSDTIGYVLPKQDGQLTETFLGELMAGLDPMLLQVLSDTSRTGFGGCCLIKCCSVVPLRFIQSLILFLWIPLLSRFIHVFAVLGFAV